MCGISVGLNQYATNVQIERLRNDIQTSANLVRKETLDMNNHFEHKMMDIEDSILKRTSCQRYYSL